MSKYEDCGHVAKGGNWTHRTEYGCDYLGPSSPSIMGAKEVPTKRIQQPQVLEWLGKLECAIQELNDGIDGLKGTLSHVMRDPMAEPDAGTKDVMLVPLANHIRVLCEKVEGMKMSVSNIHSRLEI